MHLISFLSLLFILILTSCTSRIYGVPEDQWATLSTQEREIAMQQHHELEVLREQRRREQAIINAEQAEQKRLSMEVRQDRAMEIYNGMHGIQGDLLRVTIRSGEIYMYGKYRTYIPVSLKIAEGERKMVTFHQSGKHQNQTEVVVDYYNGLLTFDYSEGRYSDYSYPIAYEPSWRRGKRYQNINLHKRSHSRARNIEIIVEAIPLPRRRH